MLGSTPATEQAFEAGDRGTADNPLGHDDEHEDDISLVAIMSVADGCELLQRYQAQIRQFVDKAAIATDTAAKQKALHNAIDSAQRYDAELDNLLFVIDSALTDMERRIAE